MEVAGLTIFLLETEKPLFLSDWAAELSMKNASRAALKAKEAKEAKQKGSKL